jgi:integrase
MPLTDIRGTGAEVAVAWVPLRTAHAIKSVPLVFIDGFLEWAVYIYMTAPATSGLSASALKHRAVAIGNLYRYYVARGRPVLDANPGVDLYQDLAEALVAGTVFNGTDPLGLYWRARKASNVKLQLAAIRDFSAFLVENGPGPVLNPKTTADSSQLAGGYLRHLAIRKANSVFSHLKDVRASFTAAQISEYDPMRLHARGGSGKSAPVPFSNEYVTRFFAEGLRRRKVTDPLGDWIADNYNVRDFLYFLLLMFGGLRASEPLHLYIEDVQPDHE